MPRRPLSVSNHQAREIQRLQNEVQTRLRSISEIPAQRKRSNRMAEYRRRQVNSPLTLAQKMAKRRANKRAALVSQKRLNGLNNLYAASLIRQLQPFARQGMRVNSASNVNRLLANHLVRHNPYGLSVPTGPNIPQHLRNNIPHLREWFRKRHNASVHRARTLEARARTAAQTAYNRVYSGRG